MVYSADDEEYTSQLYGVPVDGSRDPVVLNAPFPPGGELQQYIGRRFRITADSTRVVYAANQEVLAQVELFVVPIDGSAEPMKLNAPLEAGIDIYIAFDPFILGPRSTWVAYRAYTVLGQSNQLFAAPLVGSREAVRLTELETNIHYAFTRDETELVFIARNELGENHLFAAPPTERGEPTRQNGALTSFGDVLDFRVTPAGDRVVYLADQNTDGVNELFTSFLQATPARRR